MNTTCKKYRKLISIAENSSDKTAEQQRDLAQLEATLSRTETQKVLQKSKKQILSIEHHQTYKVIENPILKTNHDCGYNLDIFWSCLCF
tara:strand:- start:307 stop:573 length:267 start_codon:yes stop_codon:yes gene_type:complete